MPAAIIFRAHPSAWWLARLPLLAVLLAMALASLARWWWFAELFCHFRAQYAGVLLPLLAAFAIGRQWRWLLAGGALLAWNVALIAPGYAPSNLPSAATSVSSSPPPRHARVLFLNVEKPNASYAEVLRLVEEVDPDVAAFVEVDHVWMRALLPLMCKYPEVCSHPRADAFGVAAFSRLPCETSIAFVGGELPSAVLRLDGLTVIATHPVPPLGADRAAWRNAQLHDLALLAARQDQATIIGGDFNCTPWSPIFADLLRDGRLRDSRAGFGLQASWPSFCLPLRIPIDHCVVSAGITIERRVIGRAVGSDHFPVIVDLRY